MTALSSVDLSGSCRSCGTPFEKADPRQVFCSVRCRSREKRRRAHAGRTPSYSTPEVARMLGMSKDTLSDWISQRKVQGPQLTGSGQIRKHRLWSDADVERAKTFKKENFWR